MAEKTVKVCDVCDERIAEKVCDVCGQDVCDKHKKFVFGYVGSSSTYTIGIKRKFRDMWRKFSADSDREKKNKARNSSLVMCEECIDKLNFKELDGKFTTEVINKMIQELSVKSI